MRDVTLGFVVGLFTVMCVSMVVVGIKRYNHTDYTVWLITFYVTGALSILILLVGEILYGY